MCVMFSNVQRFEWTLHPSSGTIEANTLKKSAEVEFIGEDW